MYAYSMGIDTFVTSIHKKRKKPYAVPRYHGTTAPLYHCTTVALYHCTTVPLCAVLYPSLARRTGVGRAKSAKSPLTPARGPQITAEPGEITAEPGEITAEPGEITAEPMKSLSAGPRVPRLIGPL
eukprot:987151-Prorocentrum_minimum.AAC.1